MGDGVGYGVWGRLLDMSMCLVVGVCMRISCS